MDVEQIAPYSEPNAPDRDADEQYRQRVIAASPIRPSVDASHAKGWDL